MVDALFGTFAFYASVVVVKMLLMAFATVFFRKKKKAFANPEDAAGKGVVSFSDPDVERARRAHLNDIENIVPFVLLGLVYCTTGPTLAVAKLHFQIFTAARFVHSLVYLMGIVAPVRSLAFLAGLAVNMSMAVHILTTTANYL